MLDAHTLGKTASGTPGLHGSTLRYILESPDTPTAFFDYGNNSDAYSVIALQGVVDIQLIEVAARRTGKSKAHMISLGGALERNNCGLSKAERLVCQDVKIKRNSFLSM